MEIESWNSWKKAVDDGRELDSTRKKVLTVLDEGHSPRELVSWILTPLHTDMYG